MTMTDSNPKDDKLGVPPPPRSRARGLPTPPPAPNQVSDNLAKSNSGIQDMNFKMDPDFHRAFKATASMRNMAMKELLEASFRTWVEVNGTELEKSLLPPKSQG
ncbi:hypothetical protein IVB12_15885 [Bradyrhizobium sp. 179]|uniref:hypothetical protein n=1 Tax=Bradyrhizobium sp. 179 TaxID=2782648 RepID=UPI001FF87E0B|nr:hypothetical protein [Bradyrhizobium sp. 179]MCK1543397.1 hypothetical protein [Bradyrhizobium sp. 179]